MPTIDFGFLHEIADNDPAYINDVLEIFLDNTPASMTELNRLINETDDWEAIQKQAHTLKSSLSIVKIDTIYEDMAKIEAMALKREDKAGVQAIFATSYATFNEALPMLRAEKEKYAAGG